MRLEDATSITTRCFHGEPASCSHGCPFFFDVRTFLARAAAGKWRLAYKLYAGAVVFPGIVAALCDAPCRAECQRAGIDEAVDVLAVEEACVRFMKDRKPEAYHIPPKAERIAVVGAGFAGLSVALNLAQKQFAVDIFGGITIDLRFHDEIAPAFSAVPDRVRWVDDAGSLREDDYDYVYREADETEENPVALIALGIRRSMEIEVALQTGLRGAEAEAAAARTAIRPEKHVLDHAGEPVKPRVVAAAGGYTKEEAQAEAARCMGCDCSACMDVCEMLGKFGKRPQKIAIEAYADTKSAPPLATCSLTRETYSCNLCGTCERVCPVGVKLPALFHLARTGRAETGKHPKAFHDFWLRDMQWHSTEGYFVHLSSNYVFFPGCKLGALYPALVEQAAAFLKEAHGAGVLLDCCGAPAYWAGEEALFRAQLERIRGVWEAAGRPVFVFACAYCRRLFAEFLPEIAQTSVYEMLAQKRAESQLEERAAGCRPYDEETPVALCRGGFQPPALTVFDPCVSHGFPEMQASVRVLAEGAGAVTRELPPLSDDAVWPNNRCCGFGGHMRTANPALYEAIAERRASAADAPYLVYCANCAEAFALQGKACVHVLELAGGGRPPPPRGMGGGGGGRCLIDGDFIALLLCIRQIHHSIPGPLTNCLQFLWFSSFSPGR